MTDDEMVEEARRIAQMQAAMLARIDALRRAQPMRFSTGTETGEVW